MKQYIISYDMEGVRAPERVIKIQNIINDLHPYINIMCGQDVHHLRGSQIDTLPMQVWTEEAFLIIPTMDGAIVERNPEVDTGKGDLFIVGSSNSHYPLQAQASYQAKVDLG